VCRYAHDKSVPLEVHIPANPPITIAELTLCESAYHIVSLWLWLSFRFADAFPDRAAVQVRLAISLASSCQTLVIANLQACACRLQQDGVAYSGQHLCSWCKLHCCAPREAWLSTLCGMRDLPCHHVWPVGSCDVAAAGCACRTLSCGCHRRLFKAWRRQGSMHCNMTLTEAQSIVAPGMTALPRCCGWEQRHLATKTCHCQMATPLACHAGKKCLI
jgi:Mitochondrial degradasome RNA helicase subunit C terminal